MGIRRTVERLCSGPPRKVIEGTRARPKNEPSCGPCVRPYVDSAAHPSSDMDIRSSPFSPHRVAIHGRG